MKYAAIDIETTGLDQVNDQILQIAIVLEDTSTAAEHEIKDLPTFEALIWHERLSGHPFALNMNREIIGAMAAIDMTEWKGVKEAYPHYLKTIEFRGRDVRVFPSINSACRDAILFLRLEYGVDSIEPLSKIIAAGKNVGTFDIPFLEQALNGDFSRIFYYRVIDVGSVALGGNPNYWKETRPPGMRDLHGSDPSHDAVDDARDVVMLLRKVGGYMPPS